MKALYIFGTYKTSSQFHTDLTLKDANGYGLHSWNYIPETILNATGNTYMLGTQIGAVFFLRPVITLGVK